MYVITKPILLWKEKAKVKVQIVAFLSQIDDDLNENRWVKLQ